jgi:hypothetical protein
MALWFIFSYARHDSIIDILLCQQGQQYRIGSFTAVTPGTTGWTPRRVLKRHAVTL